MSTRKEPIIFLKYPIAKSGLNGKCPKLDSGTKIISLQREVHFFFYLEVSNYNVVLLTMHICRYVIPKMLTIFE